ncbi:MAG: hypothetical protein KKF30_06055 [Proteobacteria bacterium]|nr:hypothetical protein [Pseudomonadota bacterium]MBU4471998.1 hypothetical protein [Pseudomonadota bacterium]MCG2753466.1 hypothetical protein [Desulfobacteraceae bacterium]
MEKKYLFTQGSAPIVGCLSSYAVLRVLLYYFSGRFQKDSILHVIIFGAAFITACLIGMVLWGRVLVLFKILSKNEAKGYPFAKPWEKS